MDEFAIFLTASGGSNSSVLLISYVLVGLAVTFAAVTAVYGKIRSSRSPLLKSDPRA